MFHKIKNVSALPNFRLSVQFTEGVTKIYDVKPLFEKLPVFVYLRNHPEKFNAVSTDMGGYGIVWNDELDLCEKRITYGKLVNGIDVYKFGKQWIVQINAMKREYGEPFSFCLHLPPSLRGKPVSPVPCRPAPAPRMTL